MPGPFRPLRAEIYVRRFIVLFSVGALIAATSQVILSLGIHPEHLAPLGWVLPGSAAFILGTALAVTGLLGLSERYQIEAAHLPTLIATKHVPDDLDIPLRNAEAVHSSEQRFWSGYCQAALALCLFFGSLLGMSLFLIENDTSFVGYMAGLSADIAIFGLVGLLWMAHALRLARLSHLSAQSTGRLLAHQPDYRPEEEKPAQREPTRVRWGNRPSRKRLYGNQLERSVRALPAR